MTKVYSKIPPPPQTCWWEFLYVETYIYHMDNILVLAVVTAHQRCCWKVLFSVVSVCHSVHSGGVVPCDHYPWCIRHHCKPPGHGTSQYRPPWPTPLDMEPHCVAPPKPHPPPDMVDYCTGPPPPDMGPYCTAPTNIDIGGQDWRSVQTCSLEGPHQYWHLLATEARPVGKWAVRILLECFLVKYGR